MKTNLFILLLFALLAGCKPAPPDETPAEAEHPETPTDRVELTPDQLTIGGVELGKVSYRDLSQRLLVHGRLTVPAQSQVAITAIQGGFVRSLPLLPGQPVQKGQVLAILENPDLIQWQQDYAENQSRLTYLDAEYARQKELSEQSVGSLKTFQQTTADRSATRARLTGLAQRLRLVGISPETALRGQFTDRYTVRAPMSGVVTSIAVNAGAYAQPTDAIAHLTSSQGLYAELTVFEKDLPRLRTGQPVSLRLSNENGRERLAHVTFINQAIDADRSVKVVARLNQSDARLTPNTFLDASLDVGSSRVTALPEDAIVSAEGKEYIFVLIPNEKANSSGKTFRQLTVRRGITEDGYSQVILPATVNPATAQIAIKGAYALLSQLTASGEEDE